MAPKRSSKGRVSIPKYRWLMFWLLVLCSVALVCALFGKVDVRTLSTKAPATVEKVTPLFEEKAAKTAQQQIDESYQELSTTLEGKTILLSSSQLENRQLVDYCFPEYDDNHTTGTIHIYKFREPRTGVSAELPYSPEWGSEKCRLPPVEFQETDEGASITFGPILDFFGVGRPYSLTIVAPTSTSSLLKLLNEDTSHKVTITRTSVAGMPVYIQNVSFPEVDTTGYTAWYAQGESYLYILELGHYEGTGADIAIPILQSLRVTK